jgi:hypothetical protein
MELADKNGRANRLSFNVGEWVLLSTTNLPAPKSITYMVVAEAITHIADST